MLRKQLKRQAFGSVSDLCIFHDTTLSDLADIKTSFRHFYNINCDDKNHLR